MNKGLTPIVKILLMILVFSIIIFIITLFATMIMKVVYVVDKDVVSSFHDLAEKTITSTLAAIGFIGGSDNIGNIFNKNK